MVQFRYSTPFGIPVTRQDATAALQQLRLADRFASVTREAVIHALQASLRDQGLRRASGRWNDGDRDPAWFLPGDIAALRAIATHPLIAGALNFKVHNGLGAGSMVSLADILKLLRAPAPTSLLVDVYRAVPRFVPPAATVALLATRPPTTQDLAAIRLPAARTLVVFGADLPMDRRAYAWPQEALRQLPRDNIAWEISLRGGAVSGVLLLADAAGRLQDECLWLLVANPNTRQAFPRSVHHVRTVLRGWRSQAQLGHLVDRAAAVVAGAAWKLPLTSPGNLGLPVGPHAARWEQLQAEQWFRRYEREGGAVEAWVLDLEETCTRATLTGRRSLDADSLGGAEAGGFTVTPPRYQDPQVIWIPPSSGTDLEPPGPELLTLSHPADALDQPSQDQPLVDQGGRHPDLAGPAGPSSPRSGRSGNGLRPPPDSDLDIDLP